MKRPPGWGGNFLGRTDVGFERRRARRARGAAARDDRDDALSAVAADQGAQRHFGENGTVAAEVKRAAKRGAREEAAVWSLTHSLEQSAFARQLRLTTVDRILQLRYTHRSYHYTGAMERSEPSAFIPIEDALLALQTPGEARSFLEAVLAAAEYKRLGKRWQAYQLRARGLPLTSVSRLAGVSTTTATRAAALVSSHHHAVLDAVLARAAATFGPAATP